MRRIILLIVAFFCVAFSLTSMAQKFSTEGKGHFIAAQRLFEMATSVDDYKLAAEEFESVTKTDSSFAKTFINLCLVYSRIGAEKGEPYLSKAEVALAKYKELAPDDIGGYTEEAISLHAMRRKYEDGLIKSKTGNWYISDGEENGFCPNSISISDVSPYEMIFNYPYNSRFSSRKVSQNMDFSKKRQSVSLGYNRESGRFTVGNGQRGNSVIFVWHSDGSRGSNGEVTGFYEAYKNSKTAIEENSMTEYTLSFEGDRLVLYWLLKTDYLDASGRKLFYQSSNPIRFVFTKR